MMKTLMIGAALAGFVAGPVLAQSDCAAQLEEISAGLDAQAVVAPERQDSGGALTGDPVNPYPPEPSTAEVATAPKTSEEPTSVMPGADPSVEIGTETVAALRAKATAALESGDEEACLAAAREAGAMME